jgi:hypothetical protein
LEEEGMVLLNDGLREADLSVADKGDLPGLGRAQRTGQPTTILRPKGMVAFMDNMIIELLFAQFRPFSVCPTWA